MRRLVFLSVVTGLALQAQGLADATAMAARYQARLAMVAACQKKVADLHPAFAKTYPVALVEKGQFYVFEPDAAGTSWRLAAQAPDRQHVPAGVRAAMPLAFWDNRMACVVTPDVFSRPGGYAVILHEFVHCYEWRTVEAKLKQGLVICREAMARGDYMWELQYPFPYADDEVQRAYAGWLDALDKSRTKKAGHWRSVLRKGLNSRDWEYMTWQEWKEGLARYLENLARRRLGLGENRPDADAAFDRVTFYRGGELLIRSLQKSKPGLDKDIERLYRRMASSGG